MNSEAYETMSDPAWLAIVKAQVESLNYGVVQVVVHGARVVQIEKTERVRLDNVDQLGIKGNGRR